MSKRKLIVGGLVTVLLVGFCVGAAFITLRLTKKDHQSPNSNTKQAAQTPEEVKKSVDNRATYNDIALNFTQKKYTETITKAKSYVASKPPVYTDTLNVLVMCMQSALALKDVAANDQCYSDAKAALNNVPTQADRLLWQKYIDQTHSGQQVEEGDDTNR